MQVTTVWPIVKVEPEAGSQVTVGFGSSLSVAVGGVNVTRDAPRVGGRDLDVGRHGAEHRRDRLGVGAAGRGQGAVAALDRQDDLRLLGVERDRLGGLADVAAVPDALAPNRLPTITTPIW